MALHIVIDARRMRDFGIGTYIRSLVHALGAIDTVNQYTLVSAPADVRTLAGPAGEFPLRRFTRAPISDALDNVVFPIYPARAGARPGAHSAEPRAAADAAAVRGDHSRHGQPVVRRGALRLADAFAALPLPARPGAGQPRDRGFRRHQARRGAT